MDLSPLVKDIAITAFVYPLNLNKNNKKYLNI
jgi:hypothetical protein